MLGLKVRYIFGNQVLFESLWFFCCVVVNVISSLKSLVIRFLTMIRFLLFMFHCCYCFIKLLLLMLLLLLSLHHIIVTTLSYWHFIVLLLLVYCYGYVCVSSWSPCFYYAQILLHCNCSCITIVFTLPIILCHGY